MDKLGRLLPMLMGALALVIGMGFLRSNSGLEALVDLFQGLVLYWDFEAGEGDIVFDLTGEGNDGALKSGALWVEGRFGSGIELNGLGATVEAPLAGSLRIREAITIAAWVKITQMGQKVNSFIGTNMFRLIIGYSRDTRIVCFIDGKGQSSGSFGISLGEWVHIAGTYDMNSRILRLYVNGDPKREQTLVELSDYTITESTAPFRLSQDKAEPPNNRIWVVDEVRLYSRALSAAEVRALYQYVPPRGDRS